MPSPRGVSSVLRDDVLAQLRSARRPLTTRTLRMRAAPVAVPGTSVRRPPLDQQVYRALARLRAAGMVTSIPACGRSVLWQLTEKGSAAAEIDALEALFAAPPAVTATSAQDNE
ncbi:hypothetical protein [Mycobacterium attenuatum]|uniref:hypothetical protein n=1 Tax=Mycobacterium attenuatum TaxID=2341086 RepID=UPI000F2198EF|nr:hypothetical protein [Mycobacterium attenuatum]VBA61501.1 hypothetical protein LAUMK41_04877 [Mycobacterium attenuatum]